MCDYLVEQCKTNNELFLSPTQQVTLRAAFVFKVNECKIASRSIPKREFYESLLMRISSCAEALKYRCLRKLTSDSTSRFIYAKIYDLC